MKNKAIGVSRLSANRNRVNLFYGVNNLKHGLGYFTRSDEEFLKCLRSNSFSSWIFINIDSVGMTLEKLETTFVNVLEMQERLVLLSSQEKLEAWQEVLLANWAIRLPFGDAELSLFLELSAASHFESLEPA